MLTPKSTKNEITHLSEGVNEQERKVNLVSTYSEHAHESAGYTNDQDSTMPTPEQESGITTDLNNPYHASEDSLRTDRHDRAEESKLELADLREEFSYE